jgi:hypothetical protein
MTITITVTNPKTKIPRSLFASPKAEYHYAPAIRIATLRGGHCSGPIFGLGIFPQKLNVLPQGTVVEALIVIG